MSEAMPGYIGFMEAINHTITELERDGIIGKTSLRTRVKAINSSMNNTEEKALDDIFGFEIVTQNERDKEILMLIIHNIFVEKYIRQKNHNKSNGYFAHHCTGAVKSKIDGTEVTGLEEHILNAETNELKEEYRDMPTKEQKNFEKSKIFGKKPRYPILKNEILKKGQIDKKLQESFEWALDFIDKYLGRNQTLRKSMPIIEVQFKTKAVEEEIKNGKAHHAKYKKVNEDEMVKAYYGRRLVRGVNFPFVFIRNDKGNMQLEHTSETLISMWPFLKDHVTRYHQIHPCPVANYDMYFAKVFEDLEPYVQRNFVNEPSLQVESYDVETIWSILKNKIINESFVLPDSDRNIKVVGRN